MKTMLQNMLNNGICPTVRDMVGNEMLVRGIKMDGTLQCTIYPVSGGQVDLDRDMEELDERLCSGIYTPVNF
jgi:hypothetical protein